MNADIQKPTTESRHRRGRRLAIFGAVLVCLVCIALLAAPSLFSSDMFRDRILNAAVGDTALTISSDSASFGWLTPVTIEGLRIESPEDRLEIGIGSLHTDRTWWELWQSPAELGHLEVVSPRVACQFDWNDFQGYSAGTIPQFSATVRDAALRVDLEQMNDPVMDIEGLDVALRVASNEQGRALVIEDTLAVESRPLTPEMCSELLQLMDPMLGDVVQVEGRFRVLLDRLRIPLDIDLQQQQREMNLVGRLQLENVTTSAKTPLIKSIVRVAAELHGKEPTEVVRVVNHATVDLEIREGRLYHSGLEFGLPDIAPQLVVVSEGSVGLDESLDLRVSIPKLFLIEERINQADPEEIAQLHITGTIQKPNVTRLDDMKENSSNEISLLPTSPTSTGMASPALATGSAASVLPAAGN